MAFIATIMAKYDASKAASNACWARSQLQYMLGTSARNDRSFVIGYGEKQAATRPHHRGAACARFYSDPTRASNNGTCSAGEGAGGKPCCDVDNFMSDRNSPIMLRGALVGGPNQQDYFGNERNDYQRSEVALDYQAGFTGAVAGVASLAAAGRLGDCAAASSPLRRLPDYGLCGGMGGACPGDLHGTCTDAPWPGYTCAPGQACIRDSQWAWVCKSAVPS
jgi:hypothetical protein